MLYRYAINESDQIVDIQEMNHKIRNTLHICVGCGERLIPKMGKIREWHFAHYSVDECHFETYLHKLAKITFYRKYLNLLQMNKNYSLLIDGQGTCNRYESQCGFTCKKDYLHEFDLIEHFDKIKLEKKVDTFIPDIILYSDNHTDKIFVEFAVTHPCSKEKVQSGIPNIEFKVSSQNDIAWIQAENSLEQNDIIRLYNFESFFSTGDYCKGACTKRQRYFIVYPSQKSVIRDTTVEYVMNNNNNRIKYFEMIDESVSKDNFTLFRDLVRKAHFNGIQMTDCHLCKFQGINSSGSGIFCRLQKTNKISNAAINCSSFRALNSLDECLEKDKENFQYMKNFEQKKHQNKFAENR